MTRPEIYLILILLTALVLAGVFYWQSNQPTQVSSSPSSLQNASPSPTENEALSYAPPIVTKDEIFRGNSDKKQIIFTFDAGAGVNSAQKILETAKNHNLKLTFFSTGKFAQINPDLIKQIVAAGHEIFNHTYSHPHLTQLTDDQIKEELQKAETTISNLTGATTKPYFRPPFGDRNTHVLEAAAETGYRSVFWTLDALDWQPDKTAQGVKQRIYDNLRNGAIILMHVGDDITGDILDEVFTNIENQGYKIIGLNEGLK